MFDSDFDFNLSDLSAVVNKVAVPNEWEVTFVEDHPTEGHQDYDVVSMLHAPEVGEIGVWYKITEVKGIDHENQTATVIFEFT